jgi:hypothetical protein
MSSIVQASTIDRYIIAKTILRLIRKRQMTHGEFNLPVGKLSPALDDFLVSALRNTMDNATDFEACRLQRQREGLKGNFVALDFAAVAVHTEPIRKKSRSIRDFFDRLRRDWRRVSGPAQLRRNLAFHCPELIVRHLADHCHEWRPPNYRLVQNLPFRFCRGKEKAFLPAEPARRRRRGQSALDAFPEKKYIAALRQTTRSFQVRDLTPAARVNRSQTPTGKITVSWSSTFAG